MATTLPRTLSRRLLRAVAAALIGVGATLLAPALARAQDVKLLLDWIPTGDYAAYYAAVDRGFYKEAGLNVTIERGFGSSDTVTKIATGVAQFGIADIGALMAGSVRSQVPVRAIASIYTRPPHSIFVLGDSPIRTFKDLEGRSLAGAPGSAVRVFLPLVLSRNKVDIGKVQIINSEPATMGPLLVSGKANAVTGFLPNRPRFEAMAKEQGKEVRVLQFSETLQIYGNALIASDATIAKNPELVRRFVAATLRGLEFTRTNPRAATESMARMVPGIEAQREMAAAEIANALVFDSEVAKRLPVGSFDAAQLRRTWETVAEAQQLEAKGVNPESFVTREFLPKR
ncbi:MAG: ABC transporter substrate-binding protein [Pseudomonadota bacterium]|jgi:NitT/TauT family transport system substrate-binding protein